MENSIKRHFFICVNQRPPTTKPSCGPANAAKLYSLLIEELEKRNLYQNTRITPTFCLGPCFDGPAMVVYPEGVWYANIKEQDIPEIAESHMQNGKVVERLRYQFPEQ